MSINQHSKNPVKNALTCFSFLEPPFLFPIFNKPNLEKKKWILAALCIVVIRLELRQV